MFNIKYNKLNENKNKIKINKNKNKIKINKNKEVNIIFNKNKEVNNILNKYNVSSILKVAAYFSKSKDNIIKIK